MIDKMFKQSGHPETAKIGLETEPQTSDAVGKPTAPPTVQSIIDLTGYVG